MIPEWQHCKCGASWLGHWYEACDWCYARKQAQWETRKAELLHPSWMNNQGPKYHELSEVDRLVWNATRGLASGEHVTRDWMNDLQQCLDIGLITEQEFTRAMARWMNYMKQPSESFTNTSSDIP